MDSVFMRNHSPQFDLPDSSRFFGSRSVYTPELPRIGDNYVSFLALFHPMFYLDFFMSARTSSVASVERSALQNLGMPTEADSLLTYRTYKIRWYVLLLTGGLMGWQTYFMTYLTSIGISLKQVFGWNTNIFAIISSAIPIETIILILPAGILLDRYGIRKATIFLYLSLLASFFVRCFPSTVEATTALTILSSFIGNLANIVVGTLPVKVSLVWFAPSERMFASNFALALNSLGPIAAFAIGPCVVSTPGPDVMTAEMEWQYYRYTWITTGVAAACTFLVIFTLPSKPKTPPSFSATSDRVSRFEGYRAMFNSGTFWVLNSLFVLNFATFLTAMSLLTLLLEQVDVSQTKAGVVGLTMSALVVVLGFVTGVLASYYRCPAAIAVASHLVGIVGSVWLLLSYCGAIPRSPLSSGIAMTLYGIGTAPIFGILLEIMADALYPICETLPTLAAVFTAAVANVILFGVASVPDLSLAWFFWYMPISELLALLLLLSVRLEKNRSSADDHTL